MTLRVHRTSLWCWAALAAVATGGLLWLHDAVATQAEWNGCGGPGEPKCPAVDSGSVLDLFSDVITCLPFAAALYAAGILVARDLENNTAPLAWTRSSGPARWLAAKLSVAGTLVVAVTVLLTLLFRWVWSVGTEDMSRPWHLDAIFRATGVTGVAHTILGLAVGALAGLLVKRTLPAMGLAAGAMLPVYLAFDSNRFDLWPRVFRTGEQMEQSRRPAQVEFGLIKEDGARVPDNDACFAPDDVTGLERCLDAHGAEDFFAQIHPESHFWPLQSVETGLVLALAALALAVAFRVLRSSTGAERAPAPGQENLR